MTVRASRIRSSSLRSYLQSTVGKLQCEIPAAAAAAAAASRPKRDIGATSVTSHISDDRQLAKRPLTPDAMYLKAVERNM